MVTGQLPAKSKVKMRLDSGNSRDETRDFVSVDAEDISVIHLGSCGMQPFTVDSWAAK
jgi:hypothetical protein